MNMETKVSHTPGPWHFSSPVASHGPVVYDQKGWSITKPSVIEGIRELPEASANARLIAAAPELLEALESLLSLCVCGYDGIWEGPNAWEEAIYAREAIAKAKGEA